MQGLRGEPVRGDRPWAVSGRPAGGLSCLLCPPDSLGPGCGVRVDAGRTSLDWARPGGQSSSCLGSSHGVRSSAFLFLLGVRRRVSSVSPLRAERALPQPETSGGVVSPVGPCSTCRRSLCHVEPPAAPMPFGAPRPRPSVRPAAPRPSSAEPSPARATASRCGARRQASRPAGPRAPAGGSRPRAPRLRGCVRPLLGGSALLPHPGPARICVRPPGHLREATRRLDPAPTPCGGWGRWRREVGGPQASGSVRGPQRSLGARPRPPAS